MKVAALSLTLALGVAPLCRAATFVVDSSLDEHDASAGNGVCQSGSGSCTLRAAIEEANALPGFDTIELPAGTLNVTLTNSVPAGLALSPSSEMAIVGSGIGTTTVYADDKLFDKVFDISGDVEPGGVTISDLTMDIRTGGLAVLVTTGCPAIECATVTVEDVEMLGTTAPVGVFGTLQLFEVSAAKAHLLLRRVTATASRTPAAFSAAQSFSGKLTLEDSTLSGGGVTPIGVNVGGEGQLKVLRSTIENLGTGGSSPTLNAAVLLNLYFGSGAGVEVVDSELRGADRGIRVRNLGFPGSVMVSGSLFAEIGLEALLVEGATTGLVSNSTISAPGTGVALALPSGGGGSVDLTLDRVTITGAGTSVDVAAGSGTLTAFGSIIANGTTECVGDLASGGYNLIEGSCSVFLDDTDVAGEDPLLEVLADNGGPTRTHALGAGSPAIDAGPTDRGACGSSDQRGFPRPGDGDGDGEQRCDIGAFESVEVFLSDSFDDGTLSAWDAVVGGPDA